MVFNIKPYTLDAGKNHCCTKEYCSDLEGNDRYFSEKKHTINLYKACYPEKYGLLHKW